MRLLLGYPLVALLVLTMGCATRHYRTAEYLEERIPQIRNILVLTPQVAIKMKYIATEHYVDAPLRNAKAGEQLLAAYREKLSELGYNCSLEQVSLQDTQAYRTMVDQLKLELRETGEGIIRDDLEYRKPAMFPQLLQPIKSEIPTAWSKYDAVIFCYGEASLETDAECTNRWVQNVVFNVLLLPLSVSSYIFPFVLPLTLSTSTFAINRSPDKCYVAMVMLDLKDRKIVYQYDYSVDKLGLGSDEFYDIGFESLDRFTSKKERLKGD